MTLLALTLFALIMVGFFYLVTGEQSIAGSDHDNTLAFYGAEAALENQSSGLAGLFTTTASPSPAQVSALDSQQPVIAGVTYPPAGGSYPDGGYYIGYTENSQGQLVSTAETIGGTGPLAGLQGVITPFTLTAIAQGPNNTEVKLVREVQEVAVPVFEFGIFSQNDLSFFAGPNFNFGGRVATNGNLFVAEGNGATLTLSQKVTGYQSVIRTNLSNGWSTSNNYNGTVNIVTTPGTYRAMAQTEGSLVGTTGSAANPNWKTISLTDYNGNVLTSTTGAKQLNLALALDGASPIETIRRPPAGESSTSVTGQERFYNQASLRILLSDNINDLPNTGSHAIVPLDATLNSTLAAPYGTSSANAYNYTVDSCHPPMAVSPGPASDPDFLTPSNTPLLGGYIEIDMQTSPGNWTPVTMEILNLGISTSGPSGCTSYAPVIRLEQLDTVNHSPLPVAGSTSPTDYISINMYDVREGNLRDSNSGLITLNGVMNIVELDAHNLQQWFAGNIGASGTQAMTNSGYIVYFSDRRGNYDPNSGEIETNAYGETGRYGNEDIVNPTVLNGMPNGQLDSPEDVDGDGVLDTYGATPSCASTTSPLYPCAGSAPLNASATPETSISPFPAQKNAVIFFRHGLRLLNGKIGNLPPLASANCSSSTAGGFSVAAENPIYIVGDYNADSSLGGTNIFNDETSSGRCHVAAAVMGDAVTLLSSNWTDAASFKFATNFDSGGCSGALGVDRCGRTTSYRAGVISGKNISFTRPTWGAAQDFGTDGGAHNFLRMLENWGGQTLNYKGSLISFYFSQQATGVYKCCTTVYGPPSRGYSFDTDFSTIAKLPPGTPRFTDVNALGFQQALLPTQ